MLHFNYENDFSNKAGIVRLSDCPSEELAADVNKCGAKHLDSNNR